MINIGSIDGLVDVSPTGPGTSKTRISEKRAVKADAVDVSKEAQQTAAIFKIAGKDAGSEVRQKVVEEARKRIEEGTYRLQGVVELVASRIAHIV